MPKEYVVYANITLRGAYCLVEAENAEDAIQRVKDGNWSDEGFVTTEAEMSNWEPTHAEEN